MSASGNFGAIDAFIGRVRNLFTFAEATAKEAAPLVEAAARKQAQDGRTPDGAAWAPKQDGGRALVNAADAITAKPIADAVQITVKGPEVFHNAGNSVLPKRQILPDAGKIPAYIGDAVTEGARRAFGKAMGS